MKKRLLICLLAIFTLISIVSASEKLFLKVKDSIIINGKNITVQGLYSTKNADVVNFNVDSIFGSVQKGNTSNVNGVVISVLEISKSPPVVIITINVPFNCGDGVCSSYEDYQICCKDCGCGLKGRQACISNICRENVTHPSALYDCYKDLDCNDENPCTSNTCNREIIPHKCVYTQITACANNNGCCPLTCSDTEDNDCLNVDRCKVKGDCNDENPCTSETCEGAPQRCKYVSKQGCPLGSECVPQETLNKDQYCSLESKWTSLKKIGKACDKNYECLTGSCQHGKCSGFSFIMRIFKSNATTTLLYAALALFIIVIVAHTVITARQKS